MRARRTVEMPAQRLGIDSVLCPEQDPFQVHIDRSCLLCEGGGDQKLYALVFGLLILRYVLALEVRVDRHVSLTTSSNGRDEIQGPGSPLAAEALKSLVRD
tara:strand:- start:228 stop:530 length:303 start_codon:yes stop_codon:yes gene_type:complete